jgi:PAS domain S-box-containing protein
MIKTKNLIEQLKARNSELARQNKILKSEKNKAERIAKKLHLFSDFSPNGLFIITSDCKIVDTNNSGLTLLEKTHKELINASFLQFIKKNQLPDFKIFLLKVKETNIRNTCAIELSVAEKKTICIHLTAIFLEKEQQYQLIATNKTEEEYIKKKILENEAIFKETQRMGNVGSYKFGISSNLIVVSDQLLTIYGLKNNTTLTVEKWLSIIHPQDKEVMDYYIQESIANQTPMRKEYRIIRKDDREIRWLKGWGEIIFDDEANEFCFIGLVQDITEQKLALEKIKNAEIRSHRIFESSKEGILILDAVTGQITDANPYLIELIGYDYEELVGKELWEIGVFKNIATSKDAFVELQNKKYIRFEDMPLETKAGKIIDVEFVSNVYMVDVHKIILCHIRDISSRKKADKVLQESNQLYYAMFEKNQTPQLLIHPVSGKIIDVNLAASRFYGYSLDEFTLMTLSNISTFPSETILEEMKKFTLTGPSYFQLTHKLASNKNCEIEMYTSPLSINGQALLISTINDISKRKLEEERLVQLNKQLKEVNALKSQFVSTVSHEFRTPLAGILSSVQLLEIYSDTWDKKQKEKLFKQIFNAVEQTKSLLDDFSLIDEAQMRKYSFTPSNIQLIPLMNKIIEENLSASKTLQNIILNSELAYKSYYMDAVMIRHIFNNIISNALKYSSKDITIAMHETAHKEIKFIIKDKGIGIPSEEIKYVLEPFYRASNKGTAEGTGFGLSIVKRFIQLHKGQILIESIIKKGTTITIILPYLKQ